MAKMGRPLAGAEIRSRTIGIRLTETDYQKLKKYSQTHKVTITEIVESYLRTILEKEE